MPIIKGLSLGDKGVLVSSKKVASGFGFEIDYATLYVYEYDDIPYETPIATLNVPASKFRFEGSAIDIDVGQHLRDYGFTEGKYHVVYYFYRGLVGSDNERNINSRGQYTLDTTTNTVSEKYFISEISKDRTEVEIRPNAEIQDLAYKYGLQAVNGYRVYLNVPGANSQWAFSHPDKGDATKVSIETLAEHDPGFNDAMIGGYLTIPDVYRVEDLDKPSGITPHKNFDKNLVSYVTQPQDVPTANGGPQPSSPYLHSNGKRYVWKYFDTKRNNVSEDSPPGIQAPYYGWEEDKTYTKSQKTVQTKHDFTARITKVINKNELRINKSWEMGKGEIEGDSVGDYPKVISEWSTKNTFRNGRIEYSRNNVNKLNTYLVIGDEAYLITNEFTDPEGFISVKLYEPLSDNITNSSLGYFVNELLEPVEEDIKIIPFEEDVELNQSTFLRLPNLGSKDSGLEFRGTNFKSYDNLVGSNTTVIQELEDKLVSGSLLDVKVNVDYQKRTTGLEEYNDNGFSNFVNFSSAEERLKNFKYKLGLIEEYTISQSQFTDISSSSDKQEFYETKVDQVKNSFDHYESFLYNESSSYVTSSAGQFHDTSWPKENSSSPYTLVPSTGSVAVTWYDTMIESASLYDTMNDNRLVNNLPGHVKFDEEGKLFIEFVDMIGQQFDESWIYVKHFTDINDRQAKFSEGISKDIVKHVAKASGLEVVNGNDLLNLSEYLLGKDIDDGSQTYEKAQEEVTEEIWKRILANLPFFQRTKGTTRAIKGLLNCYGIPSTILRVREFGGPDYNDRISYDLQRKFTYALDFKGSQYIEHLWTTDGSSGQVPETVEFRFRTPKRQNQTIIQKGNDWAISLLDGGTTNKGKLKFQLTGSSDKFFITSSTQQFYNDEMWSVMLTRRSASGVDLSNDNISQNITYELTTKQYDATRFKINYETSSSFSTGSTDLNGVFTSSAAMYIGGSGSKFDGNNFTGSLMEYRLWTEPLSASKFDNHVKTPKAYNGNTTASHADNLVYRLTFDENVNLSGSAGVRFVSSSVNNTTYSARTGSQNSFTGNFYRSISEVEEMRVPNIGATRRNTNKIRIEDNFLTGSLSMDRTLQKGSFDFAPVDSNKLGVYFSPTDIVDKDIIYSLADINYDDYIGDPRDQFEQDYRGLKDVQDAYWKKYPKANNFWDYLRILKYYDSGIFKQVESLLPARAKSTLGVLVEPNILNRSKEVLGKTPEYESLYFENAGHYDDGILATRIISGSDDSMLKLSGEFPYYEGESDIANWIPQSGSIGLLAMPSRYRLNVTQSNEWGLSYLTASVTDGDVNFEEVLNPVITGSRLSEHNYEYRYFFHSDLSASRHPTFGRNPVHIGAMSGSDVMYGTTAARQNFKRGIHTYIGHYSHSLVPSEFQSVAYDSTLFRSFYQSTSHGSDKKDPNYPAVEMTLTNPTRLITKEPGESRLVDDTKLNPRNTGFVKGEDID